MSVPAQGEAERIAHGVLDNLLEGCQVIGFDWTYVYLNAAAVAQARQPRELLIGRTMMACYPGIETTPMFSRIERCMTERAHAVMENEFTFPDGSSAWFELRFVPVPAGTCVLSVDITDRKRAEEALRRSEAMFRQLYTAAPYAILVVSDRGDVLLANPEADRMFQFESGGLVGTAVAERLPSHIEGSDVQEREVEAVKSDGAEFPAVLSVCPFSFGGGPATLYVVRDLTDRRRLEQSLRTTEEQFRHAQKMEAVGRLAGGVAHDFNNLLSVILCYSELAVAHVPPGSPLRLDLQEIARAGERGADLTRQLLAFSRQQVLRPRIVDLNAVLDTMDKMLRRLIGADVELRTIAAPDLWSVSVDPGQIDQIVMNLAVNARDAMPKGGELTIETANVVLDADYARQHLGTAAGPHVMVAVSDSGVGMDAATQARIFEPFFTTKSVGKGTGLGLSTVFGIVQQSRGSIWVYSEPGRGTTFKVYFPRAHDAAGASASPAPTALARGGSETLLLVDDDDQVRRLVQEILNRSGYDVLAAASPAEALALSGRHEGAIHLLLTDVVMPGMSGRDLAQRLAAPRPAMRVLYMSGYTGSVAVQQGVLEETDLMLQKPFVPDMLLRAIRQAMD